jgi:transglutaminase-like putative cysteine protease
MLFHIKHVTKYAYERPASHSRNQVRLTPIDAADQKLIAFKLEVSPAAEISQYKDGFGNISHSIDLRPSHTELVISSSSIVERNASTFQKATQISIRDYLIRDEVRKKKYGEFLNPSRYIPFSERLRKFFWSVRPQLSEDVTAYAERMMLYVHDQFGYDRTTTNVHSTIDDILTLGGGVCQDFAHLSIGLLRLAGVPARYVSGYLAPEPQNLTFNPPRLASHAWIEALLSGAGWTGFDPTHRIRTTLRHITVAVGRDFSDLPMISGVYRSGGGLRSMTYELQISPEAAHQGNEVKRSQ